MEGTILTSLMWDNVIEIKFNIFDKSSSRTKHNWHFINAWLMLLSWMFISLYTSFIFFVKKFTFSNVNTNNVSQYDIRM